MADDFNNAVKAISPAGVVTTIGSSVSWAYVAAVAVTPSGDVYASDFSGHKVRMIPGGAGSAVVDAYTGSGAFTPWGIAFDDSGNMFVADESGGPIYKVANYGSGTASVYGSVGAYPQGIALAGNGDLYIAVYGTNNIMMIPAGGGTPVEALAANSASPDLNRPRGVFVTAAGDIYVADTDNHRVLKYAGGAGTPTTVGSGFNQPFSVFVGQTGDVYVADAGNNLIKKVPGGTGTPEIVGGSGWANNPAGIVGVNC